MNEIKSNKQYHPQMHSAEHILNQIKMKENELEIFRLKQLLKEPSNDLKEKINLSRNVYDPYDVALLSE